MYVLVFIFDQENNKHCIKLMKREKFFHIQKWMEQDQDVLHPVVSDVPDDKTLLEISDLLVRMRELVSDITAIEVSKYGFTYNSRPPYTNMIST